MLASRQAGKSEVAGRVVLKKVLLEPGSLVLILSPTERQSGYFFRTKVLRPYELLGRPVKPARQPGRLELELSNGSHVVALPDNEAGVRCYSSVKLLVIDEAARVDDALYHAVRPMLAVGHGALVALSTPWAKQGWFYEEWKSTRRWQRVRVPAALCPRISPEFLAEELESKGQRWYDMEYNCTFSNLVSSLFSEESIEAACSDKPGWF